ASELQQVEPQDCAAGQQALPMHESPEAQQTPLQKALAHPPVVVPPFEFPAVDPPPGVPFPPFPPPPEPPQAVMARALPNRIQVFMASSQTDAPSETIDLQGLDLQAPSWLAFGLIGFSILEVVDGARRAGRVKGQGAARAAGDDAEQSRRGGRDDLRRGLPD